QMESELNISVPKSKESKEASRSPGEIIINITEDGQYMVNQQKLRLNDLQAMLQQVSELFPNQPVIMRADDETFHKHVVEVLDACAKAEIWDISFATSTEGP